MVYANNPRTLKGKAERSEVQAYPLLAKEFKANLAMLRDLL